MFSITPSEILVIFVIALIVFGPRKLVEVSRQAGRIAGQLRRTAEELRAGLDEEIRELKDGLDAELGEIKEIKPGIKDDVGQISKPFREASTTLAASGKELVESAEGELKWVDKPVKASGDEAASDDAEAPEGAEAPEPEVEAAGDGETGEAAS